jgi:hypothetical protein
MLRAVSAVAVATISSFVARGLTSRQRAMKLRTYSALNSSRPVDFGGGAAK